MFVSSLLLFKRTYPGIGFQKLIITIICALSFFNVGCAKIKTQTRKEKSIIGTKKETKTEANVRYSFTTETLEQAIRVHVDIEDRCSSRSIITSKEKNYITREASVGPAAGYGAALGLFSLSAIFSVASFKIAEWGGNSNQSESSYDKDKGKEMSTSGTLLLFGVLSAGAGAIFLTDQIRALDSESDWITMKEETPWEASSCNKRPAAQIPLVVKFNDQNDHHALNSYTLTTDNSGNAVVSLEQLEKTISEHKDATLPPITIEASQPHGFHIIRSEKYKHLIPKRIDFVKAQISDLRKKARLASKTDTVLALEILNKALLWIAEIDEPQIASGIQSDIKDVKKIEVARKNQELKKCRAQLAEVDRLIRAWNLKKSENMLDAIKESCDLEGDIGEKFNTLMDSYRDAVYAEENELTLRHLRKFERQWPAASRAAILACQQFVSWKRPWENSIRRKMLLGQAVNSAQIQNQLQQKVEFTLGKIRKAVNIFSSIYKFTDSPLRSQIRVDLIQAIDIIRYVGGCMR